jgi:hypothetical protein
VLTRGIVLSLSASLLALVPGSATQADTLVIGVTASAGEHAAGMPATTEAWRSLTYATMEGDEFSDVLQASATLGAPPPAGESVTVSWILGRQQPDRCEGLFEVTGTTSTVGAGDTVSVERPLPPGLVEARPTCVEVVLGTTGSPRSDVLVGLAGERRTPAGAEARPAGRLRLVAGRTTPAILLVSSQARATGHVSVSGSSPAASMTPLEVGPLAAGEVRPVVARFHAPRAAVSRMGLSARDDWGSESFDATYPFAARRNPPKRPLPGRYSTPDGQIGFVLRPDFSIRRLKAGVMCGTSTPFRAVWPAELRMPERGVVAGVSRVGDEWFGTQLMGDRSYSVKGVFAYTSPTCFGSVDFVVLHESVLDRRPAAR